MKTCIKIIILLLISIAGMAQQHYTDSLRKILNTAKADSSRYSALSGVGEFYVETNPDSAIHYLDRALDIARKNNKGLNEAATLARKGYVLQHQEKYPESLLCFREALDLASDPASGATVWNTNMGWLYLSTPDKSRLTILAGIHLLYSFLMQATGDYSQYQTQLRLSRKYATEAENINFMGVVNMNLGVDCYFENRIDSALILEKDAERTAKQTGYNKYQAFIELALAQIYSKKVTRLSRLNIFTAV